MVLAPKANTKFPSKRMENRGEAEPFTGSRAFKPFLFPTIPRHVRLSWREGDPLFYHPFKKVEIDAVSTKDIEVVKLLWTEGKGPKKAARKVFGANITNARPHVSARKRTLTSGLQPSSMKFPARVKKARSGLKGKAKVGKYDLVLLGV